MVHPVDSRCVLRPPLWVLGVQTKPRLKNVLNVLKKLIPPHFEPFVLFIFRELVKYMFLVFFFSGPQNNSGLPPRTTGALPYLCPGHPCLASSNHHVVCKEKAALELIKLYLPLLPTGAPGTTNGNGNGNGKGRGKRTG